MSKKELGLQIENFEDYIITSEGDVWSKRRKKPIKLKPQKASQSKKGYLQVRLFNEYTRRGKLNKTGGFIQKGQLHYLHRLVYEHFVGEIPAGKEIDHIDGNPHNNNIDNLQIITRRENMVKYAHRLSKETGRRYLRAHRDDILEDFKVLKSMKAVADKWNCSKQHIRRVVKNLYYSTKGESIIFDESINDKWMITDFRTKHKDDEFWM